MDLRQGIRMKTNDMPIDIPLLKHLRSHMLELCELYAAGDMQRFALLFISNFINGLNKTNISVFYCLISRVVINYLENI